MKFKFKPVESFEDVTYDLEQLESTTSGLLPAGGLSMYAGATAPNGYLLCDGTSYLRATYPNLFAAIGTTYGTADATHFNVPDMRGRVPLGAGTGTAAGATAHALGSTPTSGSGGEETHTLTIAEMPGHTHTPDSQTLGVNTTASFNTEIAGFAAGGAFGNSGRASGTNVSGSRGGGGAHNIMQPVTSVNFLIKT